MWNEKCSFWKSRRAAMYLRFDILPYSSLNWVWCNQALKSSGILRKESFVLALSWHFSSAACMHSTHTTTTNLSSEWVCLILFFKNIGNDFLLLGWICIRGEGGERECVSKYSKFEFFIGDWEIWFWEWECFICIVNNFRSSKNITFRFTVCN